MDHNRDQMQKHILQPANPRLKASSLHRQNELQYLYVALRNHHANRQTDAAFSSHCCSYRCFDLPY